MEPQPPAPPAAPPAAPPLIGAPPPPFDPAAGKRPGSGIVKFWSILLLLLGLWGLFLVVGGLVQTVGVGVFVPTIDASASTQSRLNAMMHDLIAESTRRFTFWAEIGLQAVIAVITIWAALDLMKTRPAGRRLAILRALLVLVVYTPIALFEGFAQLELVNTISDVSMEAQLEAQNITGERAREAMQVVSPYVRGAALGSVLVFLLLSVLINILLLMMLSLEKVKQYLAEGPPKRPVLVGYDATMGMVGPPPGASTH